MKAIIFDLDGTLYDNSRLPIWLILNCITSVVTLKTERNTRKELMGRHFGESKEYFKQLFATMAQKRGSSPEKAEHWYYAKYMPTMTRVLAKHYRLKDGVADELAQLRKAGIKTAVFSDYDHILERMHAVGLDPEWFDVCIDAPSAGGLKPCRESFLRIAQLLGEDPKDILVIGDRDDTDGQGARNSGMQFLLVNKKDPFLRNIHEIKQ